ncbi:MAG: hypothetical protein ACTSUE_00270 [Promethearchaeota archaeon]
MSTVTATATATATTTTTTTKTLMKSTLDLSPVGTATTTTGSPTPESTMPITMNGKDHNNNSRDEYDLDENIEYCDSEEENEENSLFVKLKNQFTVHKNGSTNMQPIVESSIQMPEASSSNENQTAGLELDDTSMEVDVDLNASQNSTPTLKNSDDDNDDNDDNDENDNNDDDDDEESFAMEMKRSISQLEERKKRFKRSTSISAAQQEQNDLDIEFGFKKSNVEYNNIDLHNLHDCVICVPLRPHISGSWVFSRMNLARDMSSIPGMKKTIIIETHPEFTFVSPLFSYVVEGKWMRAKAKYKEDEVDNNDQEFIFVPFCVTSVSARPWDKMLCRLILKPCIERGLISLNEITFLCQALGNDFNNPRYFFQKLYQECNNKKEIKRALEQSQDAVWWAYSSEYFRLAIVSREMRNIFEYPLEKIKKLSVLLNRQDYLLMHTEYVCHLHPETLLAVDEIDEDTCHTMTAYTKLLEIVAYEANVYISLKSLTCHKFVLKALHHLKDHEIIRIVDTSNTPGIYVNWMTDTLNKMTRLLQKVSNSTEEAEDLTTDNPTEKLESISKVLFSNTNSDEWSKIKDAVSEVVAGSQAWISVFTCQNASADFIHMLNALSDSTLDVIYSDPNTPSRLSENIPTTSLHNISSVLQYTEWAAQNNGREDSDSDSDSDDDSDSDSDDDDTKDSPSDADSDEEFAKHRAKVRAKSKAKSKLRSMSDSDFDSASKRKKMEKPSEKYLTTSDRILVFADSHLLDMERDICPILEHLHRKKIVPHSIVFIGDKLHPIDHFIHARRLPALLFIAPSSYNLPRIPVGIKKYCPNPHKYVKKFNVVEYNPPPTELNILPNSSGRIPLYPGAVNFRCAIAEHIMNRVSKNRTVLFVVTNENEKERMRIENIVLSTFDRGANAWKKKKKTKIHSAATIRKRNKGWFYGGDCLSVTKVDPRLNNASIGHVFRVTNSGLGKSSSARLRCPSLKIGSSTTAVNRRLKDIKNGSARKEYIQIVELVKNNPPGMSSGSTPQKQNKAKAKPSKFQIEQLDAHNIFKMCMVVHAQDLHKLTYTPDFVCLFADVTTTQQHIIEAKSKPKYSLWVNGMPPEKIKRYVS